MKNKIIALFTIFAIVTAAASGICLIAGSDSSPDKSEDSISIVTSFYPIYIIALNVCDGVDDVTVTNLTPNQTGCLHEYQFTTSDMKTIENCDVFLINGGGMESFLTDVAGKYADLEIVDSSKGAHFLEGEEHDFASNISKILQKE